MAINKNEIPNLIDQLKSLLHNHEFFNEIELHPLCRLRDELEAIDNNSETIPLSEQRQSLFDLHSFEIKTFLEFIQQSSSKIPLAILTAIIDLLRLQIYISLNIHPSISEYYFNFSLTYLISESTIDYLINSNDDGKHRSKFDEDFLYFFVCIGSRAMYIKTMFSYSTCISHKTIPTFFELTPSTERLLQSLPIYLNHSLSSSSSSSSSPTTIALLKWLLNATNVCGFIPYFIQTDYPKTILTWLKTKRNLCTQSWMLIINILYNLSRHWSGVEALNKLKAIDMLKQWKIELNMHDKDTLLAYYLVYGNLLEPEQLKQEPISNIQIILNDILDQTIQAFASTNLSHGPYNVCEYLNGLSKIVVNDTILIYILSYKQIYDLFLEKFLLFNRIYHTSILYTIICASLYAIFWSISFQSEYNTQLKSNEEFLSQVRDKANIQTNDEYIVDIRQAAKGILFNLDCIEINSDSIELDDENQLKIMISYAHKDTKFCHKLVQYLEEHFLGDIWVDFKKLSSPYEDDWEEIAKAITQCDVILMIVTENYCSSKSCRREVIHADKRNKRMIPIYQGRDYVPEDWFEIRVGSATWVRFSDKKCDDDVFDLLLGLINVQKKPTAADNSQEIIVDLTVEPIEEIIKAPICRTHIDTPVEQWTSDEVQQWLNLPPSVLQLNSGRALLAYINLLSNPLVQSEEYDQRMNNQGITREQFANLIASFSSLQTLSNRLPNQWSYEEIQLWFERNRLSKDLYELLKFTNGSQLLTYAKLLVHSTERLDREYHRLSIQLDEYARFISALEKLLEQTNNTEQQSTDCIIL